MTRVSLEQLITRAKQGQVVSFPTDTVPALAVRPDNAEAIFQLKQRDPNKPLILMGASLDQLQDYVKGTPQAWERWKAVAHQHFPGQLTLVLPSSSQVPSTVNPETPDSIGIRIPNHETALTIFQQTGVLATTSANRSGESPLTTPETIHSAFPDVLVLDQFPAIPPSGTPSTVAKWTGSGWDILRQGKIVIEQ